MDGYDQLVWGLASALVAFLLGLAWRRMVRLLVYWRARHFWRGLLAGRPAIVLSKHRVLGRFEASGLVGAGDLAALRELTEHFARIGFKRHHTVYNDEPIWADDGAESALLRGNLILLGGPDSNRVTREVLERTALGIDFLELSTQRLLAIQRRPDERPAPIPGRGFPALRVRARRPEQVWRVPAFRDRETGQIIGPEFDGDQIRKDCGLIVRTTNPFSPGHEVVIFCGSYGYGTWAAVQLARSKEFIGVRTRRMGSLECLLSVDVVREHPRQPRIEILRPLLSRNDGIPLRVTIPHVLE
jgi:hypothetical protein